MAFAMHSTIAIAQFLFGGVEISRSACGAFEVGAPKVAYNWRFSINSQIEPTGRGLYNDVTLLFFMLETSFFQYLPRSVGRFKITKMGVGKPPFWGNLGLKSKI